MLRLRYCAVAVCLLSAVSCERVYSVRPIPAEEDSVVDEGLIGMWEPTMPDDDDDDKKPGPRMPFIMVIAKSRTSKTTMDHISFFIPQRKSGSKSGKSSDDDKLLVFQGGLFIHHGKINTLCLEIRSPKEKSDKSKITEYWIDRYELKDENTLHLYGLDFDRLKKTIEDKQLNGTYHSSVKSSSDVVPESFAENVEKNKKSNRKTKTKIGIKQKQTEKDEVNVDTIILDDDPKKIIRYLEEHPEAFEKNPSVYKRIDYKYLKEMGEKVASVKQSFESFESPEKDKAIEPAGWWDWVSTFFFGLTTGAVVAIIAVFIARNRLRRVVT